MRAVCSTILLQSDSAVCIHVTCAGGRGVSSRVFEDVGGSNYLAELFDDPDYPDNPNHYFIYPFFQPESYRR